MRNAFVSLLVLALSGCNMDESRDTSATVDKLADRLQLLLNEGDKTLNAVTNLSSDQALGELRKLKQFEYRVIALSANLDAAAQEMELNKLGAEGWECFNVVPEANQLRVFCRKRPDTPLRFVPNSVLGR